MLYDMDVNMDIHFISIGNDNTNLLQIKKNQGW
jgi:hypothetical protein